MLPINPLLPGNAEDQTRLHELMAFVARGDDQQHFDEQLQKHMAHDIELFLSLPSLATTLTTPIIACHAIDDELVGQVGARAWQDLTTDDFALNEFPGDHGYIQGLSGSLLSELLSSEILARSVKRSRSSRRRLTVTTFE